jgi:hypothetical protein
MKDTRSELIDHTSVEALRSGAAAPPACGRFEPVIRTVPSTTATVGGFACQCPNPGASFTGTVAATTYQAFAGGRGFSRGALACARTFAHGSESVEGALWLLSAAWFLSLAVGRRA